MICKDSERKRLRVPIPFLLISFVSLLLYYATTVYGGTHCGAAGDWRSDFIPDKWPPAEARHYFTSLLSRVETVHVYTACKQHDDCYGRAGADKKKCDQRFLQDMMSECHRVYETITEIPILKACQLAAEGYYDVVDKKGNEAFLQAQQGKRNIPTPVQQSNTSQSKKPHKRYVKPITIRE